MNFKNTKEMFDKLKITKDFNGICEQMDGYDNDHVIELQIVCKVLSGRGYGKETCIKIVEIFNLNWNRQLLLSEQNRGIKRSTVKRFLSLSKER